MDAIDGMQDMQFKAIVVALNKLAVLFEQGGYDELSSMAWELSGAVEAERCAEPEEDNNGRG